MALQFRRGTAADVTSNSFAPAIGEPLYVTDEQQLYIGDGVTQKGVAVGGVSDLSGLSSVSLITQNIGTISSYSVSSNVVTITLALGQGYSVGLIVTIAGTTVSALNGVHTITAIPAANQFSFALTTPDVTTTSISGSVTPSIPDGDFLYWDNAAGKWENHTPELNDLSDVNLSVAATNGDVLKHNGTSFVAGSADIVEDTTPQLGGDLDVNGNDIVSTTNGDINVAPDGTGELKVKGNATGGSGKITLNCEVNTHGVTIQGPPHSAAATYDLVLPNDMGTSGYILSTDGTSNTSWIAPPATTLDGLTNVNVPSPTDGQVLIYSTTNSRWEAGQAASQTLHTTFEFDYGGTAPTGTVANSNKLGQNYGTWSEITDASISGPSSSTYNPTLTGITFSSSTGEFTGIPAGRYQIYCSFTLVINNVTPNFGNELIQFLFGDNLTSTFTYFSELNEYTPLPYTSYGSAAHSFNQTLQMTAVFEETTASNNRLRVYVDQNMSPSHHVTFGNLNIIKFADL